MPIEEWYGRGERYVEPNSPSEISRSIPICFKRFHTEHTHTRVRTDI